MDPDKVAKLKDLKELLDAGVLIILTQEEFEAQGMAAKFDSNTGLPIVPGKFDSNTGLPIVPEPVVAPPQIRPVPATLYLDAKPEKEYTVHDCCYPCVSGGGEQKIKLYKGDIAFEQTCPCPWPIFCIPGIGCLFPFTCPIFWCLKGKTLVTRKPYLVCGVVCGATELKSVEYVTSAEA